MTTPSISEVLSLLKPYDLVSDKKMRVGSEADGGYVMVNKLRAGQSVLSYGISWNAAFDEDLAEHGMSVYMFDHTIDSVPSATQKMCFYKQGVGPRTEPEKLLGTIEDHLHLCGIEGRDSILKMDVEGAEWDVLAAVSETVLDHFEQIVLELHDLAKIGDPIWRTRAHKALMRLSSKFSLHHVHANNFAPIAVVGGFAVADVVEVSFVRKDVSAVINSRTLYPTSLDAPNNIELPDHILAFYPFYPQTPSSSEGESEALRVASLVTHYKMRQLQDARRSQSAGASGLKRAAPTVSQAATGKPLDILLVSVHPVLEYDEINIFESLGHRVFSLGFYFNRESNNEIRPPLPTSKWHLEKMQEFQSLSCRSDHNGATRWRVTEEFAKKFDLFIVDHDVGFIQENWPNIASSPVIWRAIGQESVSSEDIVRKYRTAGLKVVRWSPIQRELRKFAGVDRVIRASADPSIWQGWEGDQDRVVTFNNDFLTRKETLSFDLWKEVARELPIDLYGLRNDGVAEWRGTLDFEAQRVALRHARAALITGSRPAPYTLGFVEAWMMGVPVVHFGHDHLTSVEPGEFEIDQLIDHGRNGFVVRSAQEAHEIISSLLADRSLAEQVSIQGRQDAMKLFSVEITQREWKILFSEVLGYEGV